MVGITVEADDTLSNDVLCQIVTKRQDPAAVEKQQEQNVLGQQPARACSRERTVTIPLGEGMDDNLAKVLARRSHGVAISEEDVFTGNDEEAAINFPESTEEEKQDGLPGAYAGTFGTDYNRLQKARMPRELRGDATQRQQMEQSGRSSTERTGDDTNRPPEGSSDFWFQDWDEKQKRNRKRIYLLIGGLLVIAAAVGIPTAIVLTGNGKEDDTEDSVRVEATGNTTKEFLLVPNLTQHTLDALKDPHSYQSWAYGWVEDEIDWDWDTYPPWRQRQRFAIACIYYAFNRLQFNDNSQNIDTLDPILTRRKKDECVNRAVSCHETGEIQGLNFALEEKLKGILPPQVAFLSRLEAIDFSTAFVGKDMETLLPLGGRDNALPALRKLNLSNCELTGTIPSELGLLTSLVELDLSKNSLTSTIPRQIGELPALTVFRAGNNTNLEPFVPEGFCNETHSRMETFGTSWCWSISQCCP